MTKVLAFGTFDIFHPGHEHFLRQAKSYGDELVVVVARDSTVRELKKSRPVHDEFFRLGVIRALDYVDDARLGYEGEDKYKIIEDIRPDIICIGFDQEAFTQGLDKKLLERGLKAKIIRIDAYKPEHFKSSHLREGFLKKR
jgi:FAD synthetase